MARRLSEHEINLAPLSFTPVASHDHKQLTYHCELLTPMVGGGVQSWELDLQNPARSQAIKGQLRFWWRTTTHFSDPAELQKQENAIWGSTDTAGKVRLHVQLDAKPTTKDVLTIAENEKDILQFFQANLPGYVLFPLQGQKDLAGYQVLSNLRFSLKISITDSSISSQVENAVKLWVLFGGLGARTRRGCGSLYCPEVMEEFQEPTALVSFIRELGKGTGYAPYSAPYPVLNNCILAYCQGSKDNDPVNEWRSFLDSYGKFRQGVGVGRNRGSGKRPGRTKWPEADAIRRITTKASSRHTPEHPAGNWFPRGAYGMPVQTEFKNAPGDPVGKFILQPHDYQRWPSPVFLKVIRLADGTVLRVCLIVNHKVPAAVLKGDRVEHKVTKQQAPLSFVDKIMPPEAGMLHSGENPYDALIRHLNLEVL